MSLEDNQFLLFDPGDGGASMEVPVRRESAFREKFPNARRLQLFDLSDGGEAMEVPEDRLDAFRAKYPKAERLYLFDEKDGGAAMEVPRAKLGAYIQKKAGPDKDRSWGSYAGEAYADAAKAVGRTVAAAGAGIAQGIAGTIADLGPGDAARRERQRALDAAPERIPTMKEAGREIGLSQKEIDALPDRPVTLRDLDDPRFGQAYRDRVRATMRRVAENAPETDAEKAHREEAERLQAKADKLSAPLMEPRNAAERAAMHFGGGVATVGELGLAAALGGPAAVPLWMGATGAAREAARQEAEGASPREAMAGALAPAAAEAAAWTVPVPVGQGATALGRIGREALTMGVKSDLAGTARRTLSGEEAPALSDRIAEDLGAAAMGGALGAAREGAGAAGRRIVRAVERDARNRAARLAALDPATALGRAAEAVTPPEVRETARNLEAAAVPENPMDAYARRKAAEANPASDFAGEAGREFLARGARDLERREADAARLAEEELATREAPQVAPEEVPPTVAPEARPGSTGNTGSEPPASGGASRPGEPRGPATAPAAESAAAPRDPENEWLRGEAEKDRVSLQKKVGGELGVPVEVRTVFENPEDVPKGKFAEPVGEEYYIDGKPSDVYSMGDDGLFFVRYLGDTEALNSPEIRAELDAFTKERGIKIGHDEAGPEFRSFKDALDFANRPRVREFIESLRAGDSVAESATPPQSVPKTLKEATDRIAELRAERKRLNGVGYNFADPNWEKMKAEDEADRQRLDAEIEKAEAGLDALRAPAVRLKPSGVTPALNPKAAAKVAERFAATDDARPILMKPYHDKETGYVVATDGRRLIATRHGFDPNAPTPNGVFPRWKQVAVMDGYGRDALRETLDVRALADMAEDADKLARASSVRRDLGAQVALRIGGKPVMVDAGYFADFLRAMEANGVSEVEWDGRGPIVARNADTTIMLMPLRVTDDFEVQTGRNKGGGVLVDAATGRIVRAPGRDDWRDDWKDEKLRPKKDPAKSTLDRMAAAQDEIENRIMRRDEALRAMDGFGRRGVDPLQDARRPARGRRSGSARGDVAAETPRLAETARPTTAGVKPATPDGPRTAIRSELQVLLDSGEKDPATLEDLARRAEAADAFATAALARQHAGTYRGTPWGTEGGDVWPAEPPPMAKLELGDMVDLARGLSSSGAVPKVVRRISRVLRGKAAGVFRASEGDAKSGKVELIGRLFGLVDADERASVERRATEKAEKTGADPDSPMYREAYRKAYEKGMADAIEGSMRSGPKRAMAVLAHEIGHWIDFLSEGDLKRGNVLGHIAALKRNAVQTLWRDPATAGLAGTTGWTERMREEVHRDVEKRVKRKDFASDEEYRDAYRAEMDAELLSRGLESHGVVREQMERLVAWFRQSDGAPEYFAKDPAELYAEAFSAWMNYPANARRLAPRFVQLMDDWIAAHGEAGRAVKRFQAMAAERSAAREAAAAAGGPTSDAEFFERRRKEGAAASMAEDPALRPVLSNDADPPSITRWTRRKAEFLNQAVGPRTMLEDMILGAPDAKNNPDAIPVFRALLDLDNSGNMARLWRYRFDSRVMPKLESAGIPLDDFRDYLKYSRLGNEITGPLQDRGAANKAGPGGVAPGYGATGARARVADLRAKYGPAIEDARRAFVQDVRRGADAGGEGSILGRLLDSPVLSEEQKRVLGNEWYVSLRRAMVPDTTREVSSGREMSNWNGIWSLRTGSLQETGDVIANTLLQDWTMFQQVMRQEARLRLVDYLKAHKPEWVGGEAEMKVVAGRDSDGNPFVQRVPKQQKKEGWRVVTFMRDGKAEGWWVPDFVAQALEPQTFAAERTRGAREAEAAVAALSRASNAALTTANLVFNPINALSRDPNGLSRYALPRVGEGAKGAIYNTVGDASIAVRSLANDAATRMERGQYDPRVVHALASGALNDTASGWGPNGGTRGVAGMAEDIRRTGRAELTEDEVRRFWEGFGNRPERVNAALAREGSTWKKAAGAVAKAWGMGPGRLNEWLGRREMSSKAASLADLEARRPDLSPEERAWWVKNMMGTPDLSNRPLLDRNPYVRVLAPFFTPFAHGIRYQLLRAFQKMPGTLGRRLAAQMLPKAVAVAAPAALVAMALEAAQEADEMKKGGRFSEDAVQAKLDEAARLVAVGQAWAEIPLRHRMNGFTFPLPGGRYLYAPTDQGLLAVESAVLGGIVAPMAKQGGGWEGFAGAVNEAMPNFGPLPNTLVGLATGYDLNMGREVAGEREQHPAARTAGWAWDNLTGRGLGILPSATVERWITGDGPDAGEAAKRAYSWPFLSSIPGAFVRKRGSGAWAARAGAVRQGKAEEKEMRGEAAAGAAAAAEGDAERAQQAARRIAELGGDPQARLQSAAERRNLAGSDLSPSERLVVEKKGKLSDASREWLDPMAQAMLFMPEVWQRLHEKPAD